MLGRFLRRPPLVMNPLPLTDDVQPDLDAGSPFERIQAPLRKALEGRGFDSLTSVQTAVLDACETSGDLQISSQTGSGKTVALGFVIAKGLLERGSNARPTDPVGPGVLIIVPTRELAAQVREELTWLFAEVPEITLDCVTGGTSVYRDKERLRSRPRILVGTPGRLLDHIESGALDCADAQEVVLDEADQMLDMGFREELEKIINTTPKDRRTHMMSATFPEGIQRLAQRYQRDPLSVEGTRLGQANGDIVHVAHLVHDRDRYDALVNLLLMSGDQRVLVFVRTRTDTGDLSERLCKDGFSAAPLSGELHQTQRTRTLTAFRTGTISVLIATDVAARGLDVPDVASVIHGAPAFDPEVYVHRSGRTGRAGNKGHSVSLVGVKKERTVRRTFHEAGIEVEWRDIPGRKAVKKVLVKRERRQLWEALASSPDPSEKQIEFARRLLEDKDPEHVVATLLAEFSPTPPIEPRDPAAPKPHASWHEQRKLGPKNRRFEEEPRRGYGPSRSQGNEAPVRFSINWGIQGGASPKRLLAHICRRGRISGQQVGAIRLESKHATFDIRACVAGDFEARVQEPDARDPKLRICRVEANGRYGRGNTGRELQVLS